MNDDLSTIAYIKNYVAISVGADAAMLARRIRHVEDFNIDRISAEHMPAAIQAKADTIAALTEMRASLVGRTGQERQQFAKRRVADRREVQRRVA